MSNDLFKNKYRIPSARADWHRYNIGWYYITICTDKRVHYFGEITNKQMHLSQIGKFTDSFLNELHLIYNDATVLSYVVMPNHIHMIIAVEKTSPHKSDKKINEDVNEEIDSAPHPMMTVKIPFPRQIKTGSLLRMQNL